jgi:hypothetical protein
VIDDEAPTLQVTITLELPGGPGTITIPIEAVVNVLDHLERDGIRPYRTAIDIVEQPTA